jgi:DNA-binding transcriptional regulator LsrR (DeoR family)
MGISNYLKEHEAQKMTLEQLTEQKTGAEIAAELGITRQAVSQALKRALKKVFIETSKMDKGWDAFEVATVMSQIFNVDDEDLSNFIRLFPSEIRKTIEADAKKRMSHLKDK